MGRNDQKLVFNLREKYLKLIGFNQIGLEKGGNERTGIAQSCIAKMGHLNVLLDHPN